MGKHMMPEPQRVRRPGGFGRALLLSLGIGLIAVLAVAAGYAITMHRNPLTVLVAAPRPQDVFHKDNLLVLLEGLDYDWTDKDQETSKASRSDVIQAVNLDFVNRRVYELSVPRDMDAVMPNGRETKINQAQSDGGIKEAQSVIAKWLGIPAFDRYVILRISSTKTIINAIGGIDINVQNSDPKDNSTMVYDDNWGHLHIHLKPGFQHLNGEQAVGYARFRHDWCSDPCRIKRQQQVLKAAVAKLKGNKFNTALHIGDLIAAFGQAVDTNLTTTEQLTIATAFASLSPSDVHTAQVPYLDTKVTSDGGQVLIPNAAEKARLVGRMLLAPPLPAPAQAASVANASPLRVDVENGTGVAGMAKRIAARLKAAGFVIGKVGNARNADIRTTEVHQHSAQEAAAEKVRVALAFPGATVVTDPPASPVAASDVTVVVGHDLLGAGEQASAQR